MTAGDGNSSAELQQAVKDFQKLSQTRGLNRDTTLGLMHGKWKTAQQKQHQLMIMPLELPLRLLILTLQTLQESMHKESAQQMWNLHLRESYMTYHQSGTAEIQIIMQNRT